MAGAMRIHHVEVRDRRADCDDLDLVQGSVGCDAVALELDAEWDGLAVTVAFEGSGVMRAASKGPDGYVVPWECLAEPGAVRVGIEGRADGVLLKHANMARPFRCLRSMDAGEATAPGDPTESEWRRLAEECREAAAHATKISAGEGRPAIGGRTGDLYVDGETGELWEFAER